MKIKNISLMLLAAALTGSLASCSDDEPFSTAAPSDEPHILSPVFPDRVNGELPTIASINRSGSFAMDVIVTPADYTTITWMFDGVPAHVGTSIDTTLVAGTYDVKIVAETTEGKTTSREGIVVVDPVDGDPYSEAASIERIVAPGTQGTLLGQNLAKVSSIVIGGQTIKDITLNEDGSLSYTVPANLNDGTYRVILVDESGMEYGANTVEISKKALVSAGADRANTGSEVTLQGINMDKIASITIGDKTVSTFNGKTATSITFTCPDLAVGKYTLTGKTSDGTAVTFYVDQTIVEETTITLTAETTLWEGHHYVSWEFPDGNPNKTFGFLGADVFADKAGATLRVYYSIEPTADYHQMQITTGYWTPLPGTGTFELTEDGVIVYELTQEAIDLINQQAGFLCVGHGYNVDRVTLQ
ncbi:MAG: hypothetical protein ACOYJK_02505 [Prevotella sp.]